MEQQNKYYTPDISELHIGYELEVEDFNQGHENGVQWLKSTIVHGGNYERNTHEQIFDGTTIQGIEARNDVYVRNTYRTRYLDKEDIESCGWKWLGTIYGENMTSKTSMYELSTGTEIKDTKENRWQMKYSYDNQKASISQGTNWMRFFGECKSINELKKIMQWLNIK